MMNSRKKALVQLYDQCLVLLSACLTVCTFLYLPHIILPSAISAPFWMLALVSLKTSSDGIWVLLRIARPSDLCTKAQAGLRLFAGVAVANTQYDQAILDPGPAVWRRFSIVVRRKFFGSHTAYQKVYGQRFWIDDGSGLIEVENDVLIDQPIRTEKPWTDISEERREFLMTELWPELRAQCPISPRATFVEEMIPVRAPILVCGEFLRAKTAYSIKVSGSNSPTFCYGSINTGVKNLVSCLERTRLAREIRRRSAFFAMIGAASLILGTIIMAKAF